MPLTIRFLLAKWISRARPTTPGEERGSSVHEQVRLPTFVDLADEVPDECDVVWLHGLAHQFHVGVFRRPVAFLVVAVDARRYQIFPCLLARFCLRNDVVHRQREFVPAAVLTAMTIAAEDVLPRQDDLLVGNVNVDAEPDNA